LPHSAIAQGSALPPVLLALLHIHVQAGDAPPTHL
jgi:hypothetical protein